MCQVALCKNEIMVQRLSAVLYTVSTEKIGGGYRCGVDEIPFLQSHSCRWKLSPNDICDQWNDPSQGVLNDQWGARCRLDSSIEMTKCFSCYVYLFSFCLKFYFFFLASHFPCCIYFLLFSECKIVNQDIGLLMNQ